MIGIGAFTIPEREHPNGPNWPRVRAMGCLAWDSGTKGGGIQAALATLSDRRLAFSHRRLNGRCYHEASLTRAELDRRRVSARERDQDGQMVLFGEAD